MNDTIGRWESWGYSLGLALLYTSAFYLPNVGVPQSYWLPYLGREILFPTVVGTLILIPIARLILSYYLRSPAWSLIGELPIMLLALLGIVGIISATGYSAPYLIISVTGNKAALDVTRWSRVIVFVMAFLAIGAGLAALRKRRPTVVRVLATMGYTFAILALLRAGHSPAAAASGAHERVPVAAAAADSPPDTPTSGRPREVIWIIFDELDFAQTLGTDPALQRLSTPNLLALSRLGVSATQAYSPARDTEVSLPSLLLGVTPAGVRINRQGLLIHARDGSFQLFDEPHSVFAQLPAGPGSGAIFGYYHPYCSVFPSTTPCVAMPMMNVGRWFDALVPFSQPIGAGARWLPGSGKIIPGTFFRLFEPMYRISEETLREFPDYLKLRTSSLVFMHVNLPHAPGDYSQRALHFARVADDRESYRRNMRLVDGLIGLAIDTLRAESKNRDILLIVSSDHWHRIDSPGVAQPIPWIAWHVDEQTGAVLNQKISTVHTAELSLDFLRGSIKSQRDIAAWWDEKSYFPPLMPEHYGD
jgi:Sulfatase